MGDLKYSLIHAQTSLIRKLQDFSGILVVVSKGHMTSDALIAVGFADIVIAQDQATFSFPEVKRGLVPGMVSLAAKQRLPEHACRRLMLTGEQIDVPVAMKLGLVDFVVDDMENLDAVFERKLSNARGLNSHAKVLIRASTWGDSLYQSLSHFASDENTQLDMQDSECLSLSVSTQDKICTLRIEDRTHRAGSFEIGQSVKKLMLQIKDVMEGDSTTCVLKIEIAGSQTTSSEAGVDTVDASVSRSTQMLMINFLDHLQRIPHLTACTCEGDLSSLGICIICSCDWVSAHEDVVLPVSQLNSDNVLCPITLKCLEHRAGSTTLYSCLSARESIKSAELCRNGIVTEVVTASEEGSLQDAIARALKLPHLAASATTDMMRCSLTPGALMEAVWDFSLSTQDQVGDDPIYSVAESDSMLGSTFTVDVSCSVNDLEKRISILTSISALLDVGIAVDSAVDLIPTVCLVVRVPCP